MSEVKGTDAVDYIRRKFGNYPGFEEGVQQFHTMLELGQLLYDARMEAGLSQETLAQIVGAETDEIAQLEEADYEEFPLALLQRIAHALKKELKILLVPMETADECEKQLSPA
ncbi:MAG: transcriptional regulator [Candidatus Omnitrophota bacterium]|jgi:DNA-binding XRE family transcriptional regulator|nr:MAG: transcriptional regulator [Candidatus Omnitrophota bacterium]